MTSDCVGRAGIWAGRTAFGDLGGLWRVAPRWLSRRRTARALGGMSDEMLCDIGLRRADIELTAFGQPHPQRPDRYF